MRATIPLFAALALASCAHGPRLPEARAVVPQVSFQRVDVQEVTVEGIEAHFWFAVHNPFPGVTEMEPIRWTVDLAGVQLTGVTEGGIFDRAEAAMIDIPVRREWEAIRPALASLEGEGIPFVLTAVAVFDVPGDTVEVPIEARGVLPIASPARATLVEVLPIEVGDEPGVAIVLEVGGLPPDASRVGYTLTLNHDRVAEGEVEAILDEGRLVVPIGLDEALAAGIERGVRLHFRGSVDVRTPHGIVPLVFEVEDQVRLAPRPRL